MAMIDKFKTACILLWSAERVNAHSTTTPNIWTRNAGWSIHRLGTAFATTATTKSTTKRSVTHLPPRRKEPKSFLLRSSFSSHAEEYDEEDSRYLSMALDSARRGLGGTFPNPAVGCVLVSSSPSPTGARILGRGFHPRSGMPHAEIFALLEAAGHVPDGIAASAAALPGAPGSPALDAVCRLREAYVDPSRGASALFAGCCADAPTTAYVTLEPCCHWGMTPPCAAALAEAGVRRVVMGMRDPNPRVDGGGVRVLQEAEVEVVVVPQHAEEARKCEEITRNFVKRITAVPMDYDARVTGAHRRALRNIASKMKAERYPQKLTELTLGRTEARIEMADGDTISYESLAEKIELDPRWLEHVDAALWSNELILLRLGDVHPNMKKKKAVALLGNRIAKIIDAHVAQTLGHTVLLYRPGMPPVLDLDRLAAQC